MNGSESSHPSGASRILLHAKTPGRGLLLLLGAGFLALASTSWGQRASNWRVYRAADKMPEAGCISVGLGPQGKIFARHLSSPLVSELDGYAVTNVASLGPGNGRIYGTAGGRLWTLAPEGLLEFKQGEWELHPVPEIVAEFQAGRVRVVEPTPQCRLWPVRQGLVLVLLGDRLLEFNCEDPANTRTRVLHTVVQTHLERFSSLAPARDGGMWISGARGVAKVAGPLRNLKPESEWQEQLLPEAMGIQNVQEPHEDAEGNITAVAESAKDQERVLVHLNGRQWTVETISTARIRQAWRGPDNTYWAFNGRALFEREEGASRMAENEEISARQYFDVAVEPDGTFWLATSEGLFRYAPLLWRSPSAVAQLHSLTDCLAADQDGRVWFVSAGALHSLKDTEHHDYPLPDLPGKSAFHARSVFSLKDGTLVLVGEAGAEKEEAGERLFKFQPASGVFSRVAVPSPVKALGVMRDGSLCLERNPGSEESYRLEKYDGSDFAPLTEPSPEHVLGSALTVAFTAQNGDLWLSGERGTACYHDNKWRTFVSSDKSSAEAAMGFAELADGKVWCATRDQIWEFDGRGWSAVRRGGERIDGLLRTQDGSIWVASSSGLHRYFKGAWLENGIEEGLPSTGVRAICEDQRGRLWAGTTRGLSLYHSEADPDPPKTFIHNLPGENVPEGGMITLTFSGRDKWKYTPTERLLFSFRLDERDWTTFADANGVSFSDLAPGKHYFQARAMDRIGNVDPNPAGCEFFFVLPWYKETRLVLISIAGGVAVLFFAALALNRHRQLAHSYAEVEKKVAERTRELELASRELAQSQKMNALGTLAAGIAHDFNNILSIIQGSAQIIEDNLDNPAKVQTRLDRIKMMVEQGSGIVKAMLGFGRDPAGQQPSRCNINSVVEDTIKLLGEQFLRDVQIRIQPASALPSIMCSKDFIQQILLNFVFNAAESMTKPKRIILSTRLLETPPASPVLMPAQAGAYISVSVQDVGCGISPENISRIFEPFFTTKGFSSRRGTGLGLSMVYELAKKMEAGLAVESLLDHGSTFTLILPVREPAPGRDAQMQPGGPENPKSELDHDS